ncbi:MAG: ATP-binding protein [Planctomycetaceae bacterium]|nr:ATP-binding protein [Planctomycetaceae bacterium]
MNLETQSWTKEFTFPSDMGTAHSIIEEVMEMVRAEKWNDKDIFAIELVLEESLTNAVKHGNQADSSKQVRFGFKLSESTFYARVEDEGSGFDPDALADPREPSNQMATSGRGILLVRHFATRVRWSNNGNIIEFEKDRSYAQERGT